MTKKIMIVDDDSSTLFALKKFFKHEGFEIYTASNGKDCIKELEMGFKGVILLDIMMPGMSGWNVLKDMVNHGYTEGNTIAIITAKDLKPDQQMINDFKEYIADYMEKPFDSEELTSTVKRYFT